MVNPQLMAFARFLHEREDLRQALRSVSGPEQIVALADEVGFRFTVSNLREALPLLGGPHWAWAGRDAAWVLAFFAGEFAAVADRAGAAEPADAPTRVEWLQDRVEDWRHRRTG